MRPVATLAVLVLTTAARADRMPDYPPEVRAALADVCVIGTVTEIEKEPVQAKPYPGATVPSPFTVAVVKVETNVHGAKNVTHVRVGFLPPPGGLVRNPQPSLKVDQKVCLFLTKLPDAAIHVMHGLSPPVENSDANKAVIDAVKKLAPVFADPAAALKADKADDRAAAAAALLTRYRQPRYTGGPTVEEAIPAEESRAILAALAGGDWTAGGHFAPPQVTHLLNLTKVNGFNRPQPKPGEDAAVLMRDEFKRWAANEGAKHTIKKLVPKAK